MADVECQCRHEQFVALAARDRQPISGMQVPHAFNSLSETRTPSSRVGPGEERVSEIRYPYFG